MDQSRSPLKVTYRIASRFVDPLLNSLPSHSGFDYPTIASCISSMQSLSMVLASPPNYEIEIASKDTKDIGPIINHHCQNTFFSFRAFVG